MSILAKFRASGILNNVTTLKLCLDGKKNERKIMGGILERKTSKSGFKNLLFLGLFSRSILSSHPTIGKILRAKKKL